MKKKYYCLLIALLRLDLLPALAQTGNFPVLGDTSKHAANQNNIVFRGQDVYLVPPAGGGASRLLYQTATKTVAEVRAISAITKAQAPQAIHIVDLGQTRTMVLDPVDHSTADNTGTVLVTTNGLRYKVVKQGPILSSWFAAIPDDQIDDTSQLQLFINSVIQSGQKGLFLPGKYLLNDKLILNAASTSGWQLSGDGQVTIHQNGANKPVFYLNDEHATGWTIDNFTFEWAPINNIASNTNQVAIALSDNPSTNLYGWYDFTVKNIHVNNGWGLIKLLTNQMATPHGFWACLFENIFINDAVLGTVIDNVTPNAFGSPRINIRRYYDFGQKATTARIRLQAADDCILEDLEFNRIQANNGIAMVSCNNVHIRGIRFEAVTFASNYSSLLNLVSGNYNVSDIVLTNVTVNVPNFAFIFRFGVGAYKSTVSNLIYRRYGGDQTVYKSGRLCFLSTDATNPIVYNNFQSQGTTGADQIALFYFYDDVAYPVNEEGGAPYVAAKSQNYSVKLGSVESSATANLTSEGVADMRIGETGYIRSLLIYLGSTKTGGKMNVKLYINNTVLSSYAIKDGKNYGHFFAVPFFSPDFGNRHQVNRGDMVRVEITTAGMAPTMNQSVQAILTVVQ